MPNIKHRLMPKFLGFIMPKKFIAITLTSNLVCYRTEKHRSNPKIKAHEEVHASQIRETGWFLYMIKYLWYSIRYGYKGNPYEIEAQRISGYPSK